MFGFFTQADAVVAAAAITAAGGLAVVCVSTYRNARDAAKAAREAATQTKPNGGTSMRDAVDQLHALISTEVIPRLDAGARALAAHADRLAVLEARDPSSRTRSGEIDAAANNLKGQPA